MFNPGSLVPSQTDESKIETPKLRAQPGRGFESDNIGNNTILCDGRIIGGPEKYNYMGTLSLIVIPTLLFLAFPGVSYIQKYDQYHPLIVTATLLIIASTALTVTAFSDPGIIPRVATAEVDWDARKDPPRIQSFGISGRIIDIKWCPTCKVFRPPRAFHCNICQNCVERFDHHCPWIGNCIGIRNYGWFSCFVYTLFIQAIWMLAFTIEIVRLGAISSTKASGFDKFTEGVKAEPVAVGLVVYVFIGMWFVVGLAFFHMYLVLTSKTTNEQLKGTYPHGSPFSHGIIFNIVQMCCQLPKSQVHIHHTPPKLSTNRESFINKQRVVYVSDEDMTATEPGPLTMSMASETGSLQPPNGISSSVENENEFLGDGNASASSFAPDSSLHSHTTPSPLASSSLGNVGMDNRFSTSQGRTDRKFDVVDGVQHSTDSSEVSENDLLAVGLKTSDDNHAVVPTAVS